MNCSTTFPAVANATFPIILPVRPKPRPDAIIDDIRAQLASTTDPAREAELLSLGIELLRRRQVGRGRA